LPENGSFYIINISTRAYNVLPSSYMRLQPVLFIKNEKTLYKQKNISVLLFMLRDFYFYTFFPRAQIFGHLLRCESLEVRFAEKHKKIFKSIG
jgi:hypothetical protein